VSIIEGKPVHRCGRRAYPGSMIAFVERKKAFLSWREKSLQAGVFGFLTAFGL
jgi:hypothetical protein